MQQWKIDTDASRRFFRQTLHVDFGSRPSRSIHEGLHLAAIAGAWNVLQRSQLGLELRPEGLLLTSQFPAGLDHAAVNVTGARRTRPAAPPRRPGGCARLTLR